MGYVFIKIRLRRNKEKDFETEEKHSNIKTAIKYWLLVFPFNFRKYKLKKESN